jgi:hypothetical protein
LGAKSSDDDLRRRLQINFMPSNVASGDFVRDVQSTNPSGEIVNFDVALRRS